MNELRLGYDQEADVLYLSFGEPQKGMEYIEVDHDIIVRVHPHTKNVVGLTVIDFAKRFSVEDAPARLPMVGELVMV